MTIEAALKIAEEKVERWGQASDVFTGCWLHPRDATIGVGIDPDGDDEATRELLQAVVPAGVGVRVRLVSAAWVRLRQVQVQLSYYLDDEGVWGRYAVALGVDRAEQYVEVCLLPTTPDSVAALILKRFPLNVALDRNASRAEPSRARKANVSKLCS